MKIKYNYFRIIIFLIIGITSSSLHSQVVSLELFDADAGELGGNPGSFRVSLSSMRAVDTQVEVLVDLSASTAISGTSAANGDRTAINGIVIIPANQLSFIINVSVFDDGLVEGDEIIKLDLVSATGVFISLANNSATLVIEDDDFATLSINDSDANEGLGLSFTISSDEPVEYDYNVQVDFSGGDALGGGAGITHPQDYNSTFQIITFPKGSTAQNFSVPTGNDNVIEDDETFGVQLTNPTNSNVSTFGAAAKGTIINDDIAGVTVGPISGNTGENGSAATFLVTLNTQPTAAVTIALSSNNTAEGTVAPSVAIPVASWETGVLVTVTGVDDAVVDGDISYSIITGNVTSTDLNYNVLTGGDVANVPVVNIDDDVPLIASIASTDATANESPLGNGVFTIDLGATNNTGSPIVVNYTRTGTAISGADFTALTGSVSIPNGQSTGLVTITPINDTDIESNETVILTLAAGTGYSIGTPISATVVIVSEDSYVAQITASDGAAAESNGAVSPGEFTVSLSAPNNTTGPIIVNYAISGTAGNSVDYTAINANAVSIPVGEQEVEIDILPINDAIQEGAETVILTLATGTGYVLGSGPTRTATVQIDDNDIASLTISDESLNEDDAAGEIVFDVVLDLAVVTGTTVSYSFFDDTATGGGVDYTGTNGLLIFTGTANEIQTITVPVNNDAVLENTETFTVQLGLPTNNVQRADGGTAIGTIQDDDNCVAAPTLDTTVSNIYCVEAAGDAFSANLFDFTTSAAPAGTVLTWSRVSNPLNTNSHLTVAEAQDVSTPASYYGFFYDAANNCASGNIEVQIVRNIIPEILSITGNERCGPGTLLLSAQPSDGASINWYATANADTPIASGQTFTTPSLTATTTYYVEATENECTTDRQPVIARIGFQADIGTAQNASICNVAINGLTSLDLDARLTGADPGVWVFVSGPETSVTISSTNVVNFESLTSGAYIFRFTTTNSTAPCTNATLDVTINVSDCESDDDNDGLLGGQEVALGLDPTNPDTDGDGIEDGVEVGPDIANPLDEDGDGIIDALDSNILDADSDGINNQQDPANTNACVPNRFNGFCDTDGDGISDLDEQTNGSDPDDPCDPVASPDCDNPIDLEVLKSVDNVDAQIGDTVVFEITVTNLSDRTARAIVVGDLLELGFDFVSKSSLDYDEISGLWSIAELEAGLSTVLTITVTISEEGPYMNTATLLESIPSDNNAENDESIVTLNTEIPEGIDLAITKTVDISNPLVGDEITFTIHVLNQSQNGETITNIEVLDILDQDENAGYEIVSIQEDDLGTYNLDTGLWEIASLSNQEQASLQITVRVLVEIIFANTATLVSSSPSDSDDSNDVGIAEVNVSLPTLEDPGFLFNQFSPNGDGTNDFLKINRDDKDILTNIVVDIQYNIVIYDRYGNKVFQKEDRNNTEIWDGTYEGKEVPKGTYFYIMNYDIGSGPTIDKGWIQLIR